MIGGDASAGSELSVLQMFVILASSRGPHLAFGGVCRVEVPTTAQTSDFILLEIQRPRSMELKFTQWDPIKL